MKRRTDCDFSKHVHTRQIFTCDDDKIIVDIFRVPNSYYGYIKFTNDASNLYVSGDYGNWIFCRPFVPSPYEYVSDGYWNEKLKINSCQDHAIYDSEETEKEIRELLDHGLEDYGYSGKELDEVKGYFSDILNYVDDEIEYKYHAFRCSMPSFVDYEMIPFCRSGSVQLSIIFDAFEEVCSRMKNQTI